MTIGYVISTLTVLGIGIFVWLKNKKATLNILWGLLSLSVIVWQSSVIFGINAVSHWSAYYIWFGELADIFIAIFYAHFILNFIGVAKAKKAVIGALYFLGTAIFVASLIWPQKYLVAAVPKMYFRYFPEPGPLYYAMLAFFAFVVIYSHYHMVVALAKSKDKMMANRLKYLILGTIIGFGAGSSSFLLVFNIRFDPLYSMFVGFYAIPFAYAIVRYQLLDIRIVIRRTLVYSVVIALISGLIVTVSLLSGWFTSNIPGFKSWIVPLAAGIASFTIGRLFWIKSKEADRLKQEFLATVAHRLRTPLTRIKWAAEALSPKLMTAEEKDLAYQIKDADEHLVALANLLMKASQTDGGKQLYRFVPVDLVEVVRGALTEFKKQIDDKKIALNFEAEDGLPKAQADKDNILAVVQILLENAVIYTPSAGSINIYMTKENDELEFSIKDNGIGIPLEDQQFIFSRFYRAHNSKVVDTEGNGLGLFFAKNIIERHNGKIGFESAGEGKGCRFWFRVRI